jgi:dephospho-CoA kinase
MIVFGLTGSIGCGKSTVSKHWASQGIPVVDADLVARKAVTPDHIDGINNLREIRKSFGPEYILEDGTLNRTLLAKLVFSDKEKMRELENITHPFINEYVQHLFDKYENDGSDVVCYDNAILIEKRLQSKYRPLVVVHVNVETQIKRIQARSPELTKQQVLERVMSQIPSIRKTKYADYVIDNNGTLENTLKTADIILKQIYKVYI